MREDSSENMSLLANYRATRGEANDGYRSSSREPNCFTFNQSLQQQQQQQQPFSTSSYFSTGSSSISQPNSSLTSTPVLTPTNCLPGNQRDKSKFKLTNSCKPLPLTITIMLILSLVGVITLTKHHHSSSPPLPGSIEHLHLASSELLQGSPDLLPINESIYVQTECGKYIGLTEDEGYMFKGIRYGVAPIGSLRWSSTQSIWVDSAYCDEKSQKRATKFGSSCFQINPYTKKYQGSEDCLFLNVWTPTLNDSANLNVMVWIHGGFLQFGSGHDPGLRPSAHLAVSMNTVFVSLNYRLYALGFLNLADLPSGKATDLKSIAGNYGLSDQLVALQWIHRNIAKFGGSPQKIITFGPDAGAASILAHLTNPKASQYISKAWLIGPTLFLNRTADSLNHIQHFVNRTGCVNIDCLRNLSPEKITQCWLGDNDPSFRIIDQNDLPIIGIYPEQLIHVDGSLITDWLPFDKMESINQIPLLVGTAAQSIELWPGIEQLRNWTWTEYKKYVTTSLDSFGPNLAELTLQLYPIPEKPTPESNTTESELYLTHYNSSYNNDSNTINSNNINTNNLSINSNNNINSVNENNLTPELLYATMVSDIRQNCPVDAVFEQLSKKWKNNIYRYISSGEPSCPIRVYEYESQFSFHLWDAIVFFDTINRFIHHPSSDDLNYRDIVQEMVKNFVTNNRQLLPKPYPQSVSILSSINQTIVSSYSMERCNFWKKQGLNSYVWTG